MKIYACAQPFWSTNQQSFTRNNKKKNLYVILHIFSNNSSERFLRLSHDNIHRVHIHSYSTVAFTLFGLKLFFIIMYDLQPKKPSKILFPNGLKYEQFIFEYSELSLWLFPLIMISLLVIFWKCLKFCAYLCGLRWGQ